MLGCRVVSCVCCGAGVMCQTALRASSWPHMHARHSRPPTVYTHAGSLSTTGIEPDSVPAARLPEGEPEPRHTCSRCLVRRKAMVRLRVGAAAARVGHLVFAPCRLSVESFTARGYLMHTQSSDASSGVVCERQTGSNVMDSVLSIARLPALGLR